MVDVVQQLEAVGADALAELDAPLRPVAHVILVVHPAVQQLHAHRDAQLLGQRHDALQAHRAIIQALGVAHSVPVAREADQIGETRLRRRLEVRLVGRHQRVMVLEPVPGLRDGAHGNVAHLGRGIAHHRADQPMFLQRGKILRLEQLHRLQAHARRRGAQLVQGHLVEAPLADRLLDPALPLAGLLIGGGGVDQAQGGGEGGAGAQLRERRAA